MAIKLLADVEEDIKRGDKVGGMKKEERRHGQKEKERERRKKKAGECRSGGVELWRKHRRHTRNAHACIHAHPRPTRTHTNTHKVN